MECIICAYLIDGKERTRTVTTCDHDEPICSICYLRLRALQRNFHCPTCKRELDHVICTRESTSKFSDYIIRNRLTIDNADNYILEPKSQMFFPKEYYDEVIKSYWLYQCPICQQTRKDFKQLRGHMINEHNVHMCNLCGEFKQVFPKEHKQYTQQQYDQHIRYGDKDGSNGHPLCEFCKKRFYDSSALFFHLKSEHFTCHLCEAAGVKFRYFNNYGDLEMHFRGAHFLCDDPSCLERRFMVFASEIDLFVHRKSFHPSLVTDRAIPVHFSYKKSDNVVNATGERVGGDGGDGGGGGGAGDGYQRTHYNETTRRERFEGGLGGRALNGEWQVELQPTTSDPRDPNRYLLRERKATSGEDFPELLSANPATSSLVINRWISVKESGGSQKSRAAGAGSGGGGGNLSAKLQGKGNDFPSLPAKAPAPKVSKPLVSKKPAGRELSSSDVKGIMNYVNSLAEDEGPSNRPSVVVDSLGNWVNVKVDKRLKKKKKNPNAGAPAKPSSGKAGAVEEEEDDEEEEEDSSPVEKPAAGNNWNSSGFIDSQEAFSFDLARALHDSLEEFDNQQLASAVKESKKEMEYPILSPSLLPPPPQKQTTTEKSAKPKPKPKASQSSSDWQSALKSVGMGVPQKPKKSAGITVIKANTAVANQKLTASTKRDETVNTVWRNNIQEPEVAVKPSTSSFSADPPPAPPSNGTDFSSSKRGWVKLGGAGESSPPVSSVSTSRAAESSDFPTLSAKSRK